MTKEEGQIWSAVFAARYVKEVERNPTCQHATRRAEIAITVANDAVTEIRKLDAINKASLF